MKQKIHLSANETKPQIIEPIVLSIGGPSGVGKTTIIRRMRSRMGEDIMLHPAFTTRPKREGEVEGVDYFFRTESDLMLSRSDPRYSGFVEARGNWYWVSISYLLRRILDNPKKIHVLFNSQRAEIEYRRKLFPKLQWIWLDANLADLELRLRARGDENVAQSMAHNRKLQRQYIDDLVDLKIFTQNGELDVAVEEIAAFCGRLKHQRGIK